MTLLDQYRKELLDLSEKKSVIEKEIGKVCEKMAELQKEDFELYNSAKELIGKWVLIPTYASINGYNILTHVIDISPRSPYPGDYVTVIGDEILFRDDDSIIFTPNGSHSINDRFLKLTVVLSDEEAEMYLQDINLSFHGKDRKLMKTLSNTIKSRLSEQSKKEKKHGKIFEFWGR